MLLTHPAVAECGVVGQPDDERGQIVKAYVVLKQGFAADAALTRALQDYVKATVAPFKYPRAIEYVTEPAADRDRQTAALRIAAACGGIGRQQTRVLRRIRKCPTAPSTPCLRARAATRCCIRPAGRSRKATPTASRRAAIFLFIGGMVGWDEHERFPADFVGQTRQLLGQHHCGACRRRCVAARTSCA